MLTTLMRNLSICASLAIAISTCTVDSAPADPDQSMAIPSRSNASDLATASDSAAYVARPTIDLKAPPKTALQTATFALG